MNLIQLEIVFYILFLVCFFKHFPPLLYFIIFLFIIFGELDIKKFCSSKYNTGFAIPIRTRPNLLQLTRYNKAH